ncbi:ABC transporter substrate-binding protein [Devriesea agamarum]|uniref:ABC transporter substrate-binding protein n=1 Tax=Devriesea agamarum TaxID=472569 RepID=UPI00071D96DE|nr:ABC transporter substrate-binding protein [Devriesea agamarum]
MEKRPPGPGPSVGATPSRRTLLRLAAAGVIAPAALAGCTYASERLDRESGAIPKVDFTSIREQPRIAALVPDEIRRRGVLVNAASLNYAPAEFVGSEGEAVGYDIDILKAIGLTLGLSTRTENAVFAQIIPGIGSKYDVGISSFTINTERLDAVNMISYFQAGMSYGVMAGNPYAIDPKNLCGKRVAVQVGTYMEDEANALDQVCRASGRSGVDVLAYTSNADAATNTAGGKADIFLADSPVIAYAVKQSRSHLEQIGGIEDSALNGIVVAKHDTRLATAMQQAVQYLINSGHMREILAAWGNESGMIPTSEVNPKP